MKHSKYDKELFISKQKVIEAKMNAHMDQFVAPMAKRMQEHMDDSILKYMSDAASVMDEKHVPMHARYKVINGVTHKRVSTPTYPYYRWDLVVW